MLSRPDGGFTNAVGGTVNNYGSINLGGFSPNLSNSGTFNNFGSLQAEFVTNAVGATLANVGVIENFRSVGNSGTLINTGSGSITGGIGSSVGNSGTLINAGSIVGGTYIQTAGLTINNGTLSQSGGVDIQGGSLRGTGTITTPVVTLSSGATISPGDPTTLGTLTINGNLQSSGNMLFRIGGLGPGQFDVLAIHGMAFLNGGTVGFNFVNFTPVAGNSWDFLYANAISGWDTLQFNLSGLSPNLRYAFNFSNGIETLSVYAVPEPSSLLLLAVGLAGMAGVRRMTQRPKKT